MTCHCNYIFYYNVYYLDILLILSATTQVNFNVIKDNKGVLGVLKDEMASYIDKDGEKKLNVIIEFTALRYIFN